ncbi:MAG TPA: N-acetylmuramoyl-L-alanine amidase [Clostridiaceae bacterium]|nr:N-acetylmuramoyl-L-alanine amidase [Clostridiaceae bacterium]
MKKIAAVILAFLILISFSCNVVAESSYLSGYTPKIVGFLNGVSYSNKGKTEEITVDISKYSDYSIFRLKNPERVVVDILGVDAPGKQQIIPVNSSLIQSVRYAQFDKGIARVVLDVTEQPEVNIKNEKNKLIILVSVIDDENKVVDEEDKSNTGKDNNNRDNQDNSQVGNNDEKNAKDRREDTSDRSGENRDESYGDSQLSIEYLSLEEDERVLISMDSEKEFRIMRLTGPDRIVVDIPDAPLNIRRNEIPVNSSLISSIRYGQFTEDTVRVVLDINGQVDYEADTKEGVLTINVKKTSLKNIKYHNHSDRVYLTLNGAKLTEGGEFLKNLYTSSYEDEGKKYIITFPSKLANLGTGMLNINDNYLKSIEIIEDKESGNTSIIFDAKDTFKYLVFTRSEANDTAITVLKPASDDERLVVIDAGHGGAEPGAIYGNLYEKELNLDIAKRLNRLLVENNIKTYMIRQEDITVALYERAYIANALNAKLFLSIHNNAMADVNYGGTMTLYYPQNGRTGINGKTFAEIIQRNLVDTLKTIDRSIRERPNLVVLKATKMPAALAEIAFLTNSEDRNNLRSEEFREKAAQALFKGIMEALEKIK